MVVVARGGVAQAENLVLLKTEGGAQIPAAGKDVDETITIHEPEAGCKFTMPEGNLKANEKPTLEIAFSSSSEVGCEGGSTKARFNTTIFSVFLGLRLTAEAGKSHAKVKIGSCLYDIEQMSGLLAEGVVETEISGQGKLHEGTGCEAERTFTATAILTEHSGKQTLYLTSR